MSVFTTAFERIKSGTNPLSEVIRSLGRIGADEDLHQEGTLDYMVGEGYEMMGIGYHMNTPPEGMVEFTRHILSREGINLPEPLASEMIANICMMALRYMDVWDPRFPFYYTEVIETSDWMKYTYRVQEFSHDRTKEARIIGKEEVPKLETFARIEGQDESYFQEFYNEPEFRYSMFPIQSDMVADYFRDYANNGDMDHYISEFSEEASTQIDAIFFDEKGKRKLYINKAGEPETRLGYTTGSRHDLVDIVEHTVEIMACAGLVWFCSPMARRFRCDHHEIYYTIDKYSEILIFDYCIYTPVDYEKIPLRPTCCNLCGLDAYCVEIIHGVQGESLQVCNGCVSKGRPPLPKATCGTVFCKHIECPHNKYNGMGERGRYAMDRENPYSYVSYKQKQAPKKEQDLISMAYDRVAGFLQ